MAVIDIKIISDVICPFCYLGKKRLESALDLYRKTVPNSASDSFVISWLPFYLDPTAPKKGIPTSERLAQRFGASQVPVINARMSALGAAEGINFTHNGKCGNTRDAHRLIQFAKQQSDPAVQDAVVSNLFRAYFEEGGDITSHDLLVDVATRTGLDAAEARAWLADGQERGGPEVDAEVAQAVAHDIHGVPHFVINDTTELSGAQDPGALLQALLAAKARA